MARIPSDQPDAPAAAGLDTWLARLFAGARAWRLGLGTAGLSKVRDALRRLDRSDRLLLAVYCGIRFFGTSDVPAMLRWGAGFFLGTFVALNAKNWYWMQMERLATTRAIKRVELLVAHLAAELHARP